MLDKYKDKNEFYSLVGIKCYSYVPSLLLAVLAGCILLFLKRKDNKRLKISAS
ncbi:hypothetical protein [Spiroplasma endosymbiont of Tipula paludosa]|uniref:hypothetical protein n=1 Tax=Spiroplasma endosymbiont of Tipula paludosa TaxID=3066295 RepID=UPI0035C8DBD7